MSPAASSSTAISVSRAGQELGTWSATDIDKMLAAGVLTATNHFWREGMTQWDHLGNFASVPSSPSPPSRPTPPPAAATGRHYPVVFGGAMFVDKLGFVRAGEVRVSDDAIELVGRRHWSGWARLGIFLVGTFVLWGILGAVINALPHDEGLFLALLGACLALFNLLGVPVLMLTLMHYFCVSPATVRLSRADIHDVVCKDRQVSYLATLAPGRTRKGRLRAATHAEAAEIARGLVV